VDAVRKSLQLFAPARVVLGDTGRPDDEDVDVATGVAVASSGRAEDRHTCGSDLPLGDFRTQSALELRADPEKQLDRWGSEMLAVERVQKCVSSLLCPHEALLGQTPKGRC
jgi:hypothetical protein